MTARKRVRSRARMARCERSSGRPGADTSPGVGLLWRVVAVVRRRGRRFAISTSSGGCGDSACRLCPVASTAGCTGLPARSDVRALCRHLVGSGSQGWSSARLGEVHVWVGAAPVRVDYLESHPSASCGCERTRLLIAARRRHIARTAAPKRRVPPVAPDAQVSVRRRDRPVPHAPVRREYARHHRPRSMPGAG